MRSLSWALDSRPSQSNDLHPFPGWSTGFYGGKLDVFNVSTVAIGDDGRSTALSRATSKAQFRADDGQPEAGFLDTGAATIARSSDGCTWTITMIPPDDAANGLDNHSMALWTGTAVDHYSGNFTMPFKVTVVAKPAVYAGGTGTGIYAGKTINCQGLVK
jgi:hypothetical protein